MGVMEVQRIEQRYGEILPRRGIWPDHLNRIYWTVAFRVLDTEKGLTGIAAPTPL